jgi:hypothetical protein
MLRLISLVPFIGMQQLYFFLFFFLSDKQDEYQLVNFVLSFKGLQFVSLGVIGAIVGAAQYFSCTQREEMEGRNTCRDTDDSPGNNHMIYYDSALFAVQIALVWSAFWLLPYSLKKGGVHFNDVPEVPSGTGCGGRPKYKGRGGRLLYWLVYDLISFLICVGLILWCMFTGENKVQERGTQKFADTEWALKAQLYWIKVLYGLLSFPWVLFSLPFVMSIFTHARPTGYTKYGKCVPMLPAGLRKENRQKELDAMEQAAKEAEARRKLLDESDSDSSDDDDDKDQQVNRKTISPTELSAPGFVVSEPSPKVK